MDTAIVLQLNILLGDHHLSIFINDWIVVLKGGMKSIHYSIDGG